MNNDAQDVAVPSQEMQRELKLESVFMPNASKLRKERYPQNVDHAKFVHYTSADSALKIIHSKELWLRNTTCMADYREVHHGFEILNKFFKKNENMKGFVDALNNCAPNVATNAISLFDKWWSYIQSGTYIASFSEHGDNKEDLYGRLSMWRAFGSNARVAIVINIPRYSGEAQKLGCLFSPVAYLDEEKAHDEIYKVIENIRAEESFLRSVGPEEIERMVFSMLVLGVICLKHEGFYEEKEWRVICVPKMWPSEQMKSSTEIIGGVPQLVYKFPLDATTSEAINQLSLSRIFERLIIGPSQYPLAMREAFINSLAQLGVENANQRVWVSEIPVRT